MKSAKAALAKKAIDLKLLRRDLDAISAEAKEQFHLNYFQQQQEKLRNQQLSQIYLIRNLVRIVTDRKAVDSETASIEICMGMRDSGMYESFFRQEPSLYFSQPQLMTALCHFFHWSSTDSEINDCIDKLYTAFDPKRCQHMEWRKFLCLVNILFQPDLTCTQHFQWGFSILSSAGYLDRDLPVPNYTLNSDGFSAVTGLEYLQSEQSSPSAVGMKNSQITSIKKQKHDKYMDTITMKELKELLCLPVDLQHIPTIHQLVVDSWNCLSATSSLAIQAIKKNGLNNDPDTIQLSMILIIELFRVDPLASYFKPVQYHCIKDQSIWICDYEKTFYHPMLYEELKSIRRLRRNYRVISLFKQRHSRLKSHYYHLWARYIKTKNQIRVRVVNVFMTRLLDRIADAFDHWREQTVLSVTVCLLQRVVRGYLGRRKAAFMRFLITRVMIMQAGVRGMIVRKRTKQIRLKLYWNAMTIQRYVRGYLARVYVRRLIIRYVEQQRKRLKAERINFLNRVKQFAATRIQMTWRRYAFYQHVIKRAFRNEQLSQLNDDMMELENRKRAERLAHRMELSQWYAQRKVEMEAQRLHEEKTLEQKEKIKSLRHLVKQSDMTKIQQYNEERENALEEQRLLEWQQTWDVKRQYRMKLKEEQCQRALYNPESKDDVTYRTLLQAKVKKQIKNVLRRADQQRIPMNIPEAQEIATLEVIRDEVKAEEELVKREQVQDNYRIENQKKLAKEKELKLLDKYRERNQDYAASVVQNLYRRWKAFKNTRYHAYKIYRKHFDVTSLNYYYENTVTGALTWTKPSALGSYDIDPAPGWVIVPDHIEEKTVTELMTEKEFYYYNPKRMEMSWDQPHGTVLCQVCEQSFAMIRLSIDHILYCESCFHQKVQELLHTMLPEDIIFKSFVGCMEGASSTSFAIIPDMNYKRYLNLTPADRDMMKLISNNDMPSSSSSVHETKESILPADPNSVSSAEILVDSDLDTQLQPNVSMKKQPSSPKKYHRNVCMHCEKDSEGNIMKLQDVDVHCYNCGKDYCTDCFHRIHHLSPWNEHQYEAIIGSQSRVSLIRVDHRKSQVKRDLTDNDNQEYLSDDENEDEDSLSVT